MEMHSDEMSYVKTSVDYYRTMCRIKDIKKAFKNVVRNGITLDQKFGVREITSAPKAVGLSPTFKISLRVLVFLLVYQLMLESEILCYLILSVVCKSYLINLF
jgi:hypothetical protein